MMVDAISYYIVVCQWGVCLIFVGVYPKRIVGIYGEGLLSKFSPIKIKCNQ
jgi:hypothetical protein